MLFPVKIYVIVSNQTWQISAHLLLVIRNKYFGTTISKYIRIQYFSFISESIWAFLVAIIVQKIIWKINQMRGQEDMSPCRSWTNLTTRGIAQLSQQPFEYAKKSLKCNAKVKGKNEDVFYQAWKITNHLINGALQFTADCLLPRCCQNRFWSQGSFIQRFPLFYIYKECYIGTSFTDSMAAQYMHHTTKQCWGSVTFWCGSGSTDVYLWLMDPDPTPFISDLRGCKKIFFFIVCLIVYPHAHQS